MHLHAFLKAHPPVALARGLGAGWPYLVFFIVAVVIAIQNYVPDTFLTGWDNLHPEFNFPANIKRSLFAVWQEYQGVGLLGGMGHAAGLVYQLYLYLLSLVFPLSMLRYIATFSFLFLGSIGTYRLLRTFLFPQEKEKAVAFLGGTYYLLNLATLQAFYTPFEAYTVFFASLPWLTTATLTYFLKPTQRARWALILTLLLATPSWYVPTLFFVTMLALGICLLALSTFHNKREAFIRIGKTVSIILAVNAFWLLPFCYFTLTNADVAVTAKINQMATEYVYLQNKEYGTILDAMLLRGFWFGTTDPNRDGIFAYVLMPWREHLASPFILAIGLASFLIVAVGMLQTLRNRNPLAVAFLLFTLFAVGMLITATPPFSWLHTFLREHLPFFNQALRFPFTKFSLLAALGYSVFFALGVGYLHQKITQPYPILKTYALYAFILLSMVLFMSPIFRGNLFYHKERTTIPKEYFDLFTFFKNRDQTARIALFPHHTFWGWNFYTWGYGGSGFLWYGINQPILDRNFDMWSRQNENYYHEMAQAVYAKDKDQFGRILEKYQVQWLLVDRTVTYPSAKKMLFFDELEQLIAQTASIKKAQSFGDITVYAVSLSAKPAQGVLLTQSLPTANGYLWGQYDQAYADIGPYMTKDQGLMTYDYTYPFRSLFSQKRPEHQAYILRSEEDRLGITSQRAFRGKALTIPALPETETAVPVVFVQNGENIAMRITPPQIRVGKEIIYGEPAEYPLFASIPQSETVTIRMNGNAISTVQSDSGSMGATLLPLTQDSVITLTSQDNETLAKTTILHEEILRLPQLQRQQISLPENTAGKIEVVVPVIRDNLFGYNLAADAVRTTYNCDRFRDGSIQVRSVAGSQQALTLTSKNATACTAMYFPTLPHSYGYAVIIYARNIAGWPLRTWILNEDQKYAPIDTYLARTAPTSLILPPQEDYGTGYSLHFDNISIGNEVSTNTLQRVSVIPIPYRFLSGLRITQGTTDHTPATALTLPDVTQPYPGLHMARLPSRLPQQATLVLSQAYAPGWQAYKIANGEWRMANGIKPFLPFLFGEKLNQHVLVNNWQNGWVLNNPSPYTLSSSQIILIYWPQYLQYLGVLFLILLLVFAARRRRA